MSKLNTASFMLRFSQNIFEDTKGESKVQWRGKISHVQGGDEQNFTEVSDAISFIQDKLAALTLKTAENKSKEEQEGILTKSFEIWKKMAANAPQLVKEAIKDPKTQMAQIKDQITDMGEELGEKLEIDTWRTASKSDFNNVMDELRNISSKLSDLAEKVETLKK